MADQDFLGGMIADDEPVVADAPDVAPVETVVAEPATPEPSPEPEPAPEPTPGPEAPRDEPRHVPLATFLDKRDEARDLKRRLDAYEAREREAQARPEIDPFDDPQGYAAQLEQRIEQGRVQERFAISDRFARKEHGAETVEAAVTWASERANTDPMFAASYMREADPVDWIVQQHKRDALLSDIGGNMDDWFAREAAKRGYAAISAPVDAVPVAATVQPAAKPAPPPRSIASERTDATRVTPQGDRDGFLASMIGK